MWLQVIADNEAGLLFKNKRDRKVTAPQRALAYTARHACRCPGLTRLCVPLLQVINVDPRAKPGDNSTRTELETGEYLQVVIYDHVTRRRS